MCVQGVLLATLAELQTELAEVKAAISAVLTRGQSIMEDGRRVERADLAELRRERSRLEAAIGRMSGTRGVRRIVPE